METGSGVDVAYSSPSIVRVGKSGRLCSSDVGNTEEHVGYIGSVLLA
jgi:hypothetical protein